MVSAVPVPIRTARRHVPASRRTVSLGVLAAVAARPGLWVTALRQVRVLAPRAWWKRAPFLPLPSSDYMALRAVTQYGDPQQRPTAGDVVTYLTWLRHWRRTVTLDGAGRL